VIAGTAILTCSICGEPSTDICVYCTKDACTNHRCDRCKRCSDCCECDMPLSAEEVPVEPPAEAPAEVAAAPEAVSLPMEPEHVQPPQETPPTEEIMP
jgi:hypothetical protein